MTEVEANRIVNEAVGLLLALDGTTETDKAGRVTPNRSVLIDAIQRQFGMIGQEYCAMAAQYPYVLIRKENSLKYELPMTASSQTLWEWASARKLTYADPILLQYGDWMVWRKFKLWKGHVATYVDHLDSRTVRTIEGNISGGHRLQGIWRYVRNVDKVAFGYDDFYLRGFVDVRKMLTMEEK